MFKVLSRGVPLYAVYLQTQESISERILISERHRYLLRQSEMREDVAVDVTRMRSGEDLGFFTHTKSAREKKHAL